MGKGPAKSKVISKAIKKESKSDARKKIIDKDVVDAKGKVHYILILDDSGSMTGKPWTDLKSAASEFLKTLSSSKN